MADRSIRGISLEGFEYDATELIALEEVLSLESGPVDLGQEGFWFDIVRGRWAAVAERLLEVMRYQIRDFSQPPPLSKGHIEQLLNEVGLNDRVLEFVARFALHLVSKSEHVSNGKALARQLIRQLRAAVNHGNPAEYVRAQQAAEAARDNNPAGLNFPGYTPADIPVQPHDYRFETAKDALGWGVFNLGPKLWALAGRQPSMPAYPQPEFASHPMIKAEDGTIRVALFSDSGTGTYPGRYVMRQVARQQCQQAVHLGDIYYTGTPEETRTHFAEPAEEIMRDADLFVLPGNHEMYGGGWAFAEFIAEKQAEKPGRVTQRQTGLNFCLTSDTHQIIGLDTEWAGAKYPPHGRVQRRALLDWLGARLSEGADKVNILVTSNQPYGLGTRKTTALYDDIEKTIDDRVQAWFWGNEHCCVLFEPGNFDFVGACIGHGGYPYQRLRKVQLKKSGAPIAWHDADARHAGIANVPQAAGNNGFCVLTLRPTGIVSLQYIDWRGQPVQRFDLHPDGQRLRIERV